MLQRSIGGYSGGVEKETPNILDEPDVLDADLCMARLSTNHDVFHKLNDKFEAHSETMIWQTNFGANLRMNWRR